jgi:hypothetical protein
MVGIFLLLSLLSLTVIVHNYFKMDFKEIVCGVME